MTGRSSRVASQPGLVVPRHHTRITPQLAGNHALLQQRPPYFEHRAVPHKGPAELGDLHRPGRGIDRTRLTTRRQGKADGANGLALATTSGACDTRGRDRTVRREPLAGALGHGLGNRLTDGTVPLEQIVGDAKQLMLGGVAVGHHAALQDGRGAWQVGQTRRAQAAGAGLGKRNGTLVRSQRREHYLGHRLQAFGEQPFAQ